MQTGATRSRRKVRSSSECPERPMNGTNRLTDTIRLDLSGNEAERRHLTLTSAFSQHFQRVFALRMAIADRPNLSPAPLTELSERLVPVR